LPEDIRYGFKLEQYTFLALELKKGLIHRVLDDSIVLPFVEEEELEGGEGAFGKLFKIKIHKDYQRLRDPTAEQPVNYRISMLRMY
jgi:hypothetical protein